MTSTETEVYGLRPASLRLLGWLVLFALLAAILFAALGVERLPGLAGTELGDFHMFLDLHTFEHSQKLLYSQFAVPTHALRRPLRDQAQSNHNSSRRALQKPAPAPILTA